MNDGSSTVIKLPKNSSSLGSGAAVAGAASRGGIAEVYERGLAFVDHFAAMRGYFSSCGILGGLGAAFCVYVSLGLDYRLEDGGVSWITIILILVTFANFLFIQVDWVGYRYEPILFDRGSSKVHIFRSAGLPWWQLGWNLFGRPRSEVQSFDWACVDAEVVTFTIFTGQVPRRESALVLSIKESPDGDVEIQRVGVGPSFAYGDVASPIQRWEYVRRFMQGEGPAWAPGEVRYKDFGVTFWESLTLMQPLIGPGSSKYWAKGPLMWIGGAVCLIAFPLSAYIGLNRYLSFRLKRAPKWPDDIRASIGVGPFDDARLKEMVDAVVAKFTQKRLGRQKG